MIIDFRSDTVTKPTPGMLEAMIQAGVGDDVFGEDPTVNPEFDSCSSLHPLKPLLLLDFY